MKDQVRNIDSFTYRKTYGKNKEIKGGVAKKEAEEFKKKLEAAGAKVELK